MKKFLALAMLFAFGCTTTQREAIIDAIDAIEIPEEEQKPDTPPPTPPNTPDEEQPVTGEWRRDVASIDGLSWKTRNITKAPGNGRNKDGGFEWIVARLTGDGFDRCLIMVMGGSRPPSRIYYQAGESSFVNSVFPVPLTEVSSWEVVNDGGRFKVKLNGDRVISLTRNTPMIVEQP